MAFEWLTGNNGPQFWKSYVSLFENEDKEQPDRYVVFDMETTGMDWKEDVILSVGAIGIKNDVIQVNDFMEIYISQDKYNRQSVALNGGVVKLSKAEKIVEAEGIIQLLNFIKNATLVSHNTNLDVEMINQALKRLDLGRLRNPIMDTNVLYQRWKNLGEDTAFTLDEVCESLKVKKSDRHSAASNAYTTALVFLKLKKKLSL
mgnify:CR=1 FL=1